MEFLVRFTPARPCSDGNCLDMATMGIAERKEGAAFVVYPYCPRHGYLGAVRPQQEQDERKTIIAFVLAENGGQGEVTNIKRIDLAELERHNIKTACLDNAWAIKYQCGQVRKSFYVLWHETEFSLYGKKR